ncbi:MAG: aldehyde dehydrogenase [Saprospiraceae bacterium]|nr:MAG: aldehyde dehydrogenase [Saprospiraceae bacterium]
MISESLSKPDIARSIEKVFNQQVQHQQKVAESTARERSRKLKRLQQTIMKYRPEIREALFQDFRKHPSEVDLTEIYPIINEIKHTRSHLSRWMAKQRVDTPISLLGSSSYIHYEPKGVVLIIAPWNFPVNLTLAPLVAAIAAGNCVMIKPSENTPHASATMQKIVEAVFDPREVALIQGGIETSQALLDLPFNHIFFTGAPAIGKIVMAAAAKNLTSVTLELGGKSPTIVDESANIDAAARRIAWAKYMNNGQICISPDYLYVHEKRKDEFVAKVKENLKIFFTETAQQSDSYARMVNERHYKRVKGYLEDARQNGATFLHGGHTDDQENYIEPTMVTDLDDQSKLMQEEIFGPVLPIRTFRDIEEPIAMINSKEKPLALYIYSRNNKRIKHILEHTRAGGTCINHSAIHFFNNNLPFGGSNNSGIGKGHGFFGFQAFSNARGVFRQHLPISAIELMMPPYTGLKQKLIDLSIKWF